MKNVLYYLVVILVLPIWLVGVLFYYLGKVFRIIAFALHNSWWSVRVEATDWSINYPLN